MEHFKDCMKPINMVEFANALLAPPRLSPVQAAEHVALAPTPQQVHDTDIAELESMYGAAVLNFKKSETKYDLGRLDAIRACIDRLKERRY